MATGHSPSEANGKGPSPTAATLNGRAEPSPKDAIRIVSEATERLRDEGRALLGVTGEGEVAPLRRTLADAGAGLYPALALGLLVAVDQLQTTALTILGPEISGALGISRSSYALVLVVKTLMVTAAALPLAWLVQGKPRRAAVSVVTAFVWSALTAMTAFVISLPGLLLIALAAGAATASVRAVHQPLLLDAYPPPARVRVLSFYRGFDDVGNIVGPAIIGLCAVGLGLSWRGVFLAMAVVALAASFFAVRLRDPGFGRWDADPVRQLTQMDGGSGALTMERTELGFFEIARRLFLIPTIRRMLFAWAVLGMFLAPFLTYLAFFLQDTWGMGPGARSVFLGTMPLFGIVGLRLFGRRGEELFRRDPARLVHLAGALLGVAVTAIGLAVVMPVFGVMALFFGLGTGALSVITPALALPMYSIVPAEMRAHLGALQGIFLAGIGGTAGVFLLSGMDQRFGATGAILSLAAPGIGAGLVVRSASKTVNSDLDRMLDAIVEEEEVRGLIARGAHLPMLSCTGVDFRYGQLQVLFGIDFTVDDGEMVALLGTNGAGKSTLLKCISGIGLPANGSIRYRGADITYVDAERRLRLGITQVPGGRAVFGPLSIVENLRLYGYTMGSDRRAIDRAIDRCFDAFPRLGERRNQNAATLSGGEQQMLALSKALILRPRLLLIDELSLGLAPIVVGQLLDMVRQINADGTAVVLVEQSVNIALSVVDHAYFMEKGEIRFDGRSKDLLDRGDLLRAVFLRGAAKGMELA